MSYTVNAIEQELDVLISAMKTLSALFPLSGTLYISYLVHMLRILFSTSHQAIMREKSSKSVLRCETAL